MRVDNDLEPATTDTDTVVPPASTTGTDPNLTPYVESNHSRVIYIIAAVFALILLIAILT